MGLLCSVPGCTRKVDPPRTICAYHYAMGLRESSASMCQHCGQREAQKDKVLCKVCEEELKQAGHSSWMFKKL